MTDLLIRSIPAELKRRLQARARRSGRSLSDEAKALLNRGLIESKPGRPVGSALVELFASVQPVELEIARDEMPRPPPPLQ